MVLLRRTLVVGTLVVAVGALVGGASGAPTSFRLEFAGHHVVDTNLPGGIRHEGRFTASAPFCPVGTAVDIRDIEVEPLTVLRTYTCDDGSGSFTALMPALAGEHGGTGTWKIVAGTGRYATLRGLGTYTGHIVSGDPNVFETIVYTTSWEGTVDFDTVAPTVTSRATAKKLRKPPRSYSIRTSVDAHEGPVTYSVDVRAGKAFLALKQGTSATGRVTTTSRVHAPRGVRKLTVIVTVSDAVGNETATTLSLGLR
jgi:hypothetical protein